MCDEPSVSREHVPPKCIFPPESHLRKNLIRVPSCKAHNNDKSCDDVLLQCLLAFAYNTGPHAYRMAAEIVLPRLAGDPQLTKTFMPDLRDFGNREGRFTPNLARFASSMRAIVRGLYYYDANFAAKLLVAEMEVFWPLLRNDDGEFCPAWLALHDEAERTMQSATSGANPEIFQYRFDAVPGEQQRMCRLRFYGGVPVYAVWKA